jgi:23S rRNA (uracil1939-C5)-methyltransferase
MPRRNDQKPGRPPPPDRIVRLHIDEMALDGDGMGRLGTYLVFVPGAIPGEEVEAEIERRGDLHGRARLVRVLTPSPHRVTPRCRHFGDCGGCSLQHIDYAEQLRLKEALVRSHLGHALRAQVPVRPALGLDDPWGFRNKVHFNVGPGRGGEAVLGHLAARSRRLVPIVECPVHAGAGNRVAFRLGELLRQFQVAPAEGDPPTRGVARHVLARVSEATGETQAVLVACRERFPGRDALASALLSGPEGATGVHLNLNAREGSLILGGETIHLGGQDRLVEEVGGVKFLVSPVSFFQTGIRAARLLLGAVLSAVGEGGGPVLDLYAGVGLFALPIARSGRPVVAVEENPLAVRDGIHAVKRNGLKRIRFVRARVEEQVRRLAGEGEFEVVVLDPPREGASERVLRLVAGAIRPCRIVYVSCDLRALARDLKLLATLGFRLESAVPVDMFPHTPHVETVATLTR